MSSTKPRNPIGILFLCTLIGGAIGLAIAKRNHDILAFVLGMILGLCFGIVLDAWNTSRLKRSPGDEPPSEE